MTRQLNPFISGTPVPPSHFIGREAVINNCYNRLAGPVKTSIAISGERGIGKTSLLYQLKHLAEEESWGQPYTQNIFVHLDCHTVQQFTPTQFWRRILELLKQADNNVTIHKQIDITLKEQVIDATHLQRLLRILNQQQRALILLLDSFAVILKAHQSGSAVVIDFLSSLRALTSLPGYGLTLITATREPLYILCAEIVKNYPGSYFYNNFAYESLRPFSGDEMNTLLQRALEDTNIEFGKNEQALLERVAGRHPALLQMAGYHLFEALQQGQLTNQAYRQVVEAFANSTEHYFKLFWNEATPIEQTLFVLCILLNLSESTAIRSALNKNEIESRLLRYDRDLSPLIERGLIRQGDQGLHLFSSIFVWWVVRKIMAESETSLATYYQSINEDLLIQAWRTLQQLAPVITLNRLTHTLIMREEQSSPKVATGSQTEQVSQPSEVSAQESVEAEDETLRYKLQKEIGRGANGIVYQAFDNRLRRTVAIKFLTGLAAVANDSNQDDILKEARAASQLQHPNIVTIYDVTETDDRICLVMEYLEGQTLTTLLKGSGQLPPKQVIALMEQAASALDYAHTHNIIHRDVKPANLMLTTNTLKLADFGVAKMINDPQTSQNTGVKGTFVYMSPEQIDNFPLDGRSDIFSLAVVAYELLTGSAPWLSLIPSELISSITQGILRPLSDFKLPRADALDPVFQKALAKERDDRYQTGKAFVDALKNALSQ